MTYSKGSVVIGQERALDGLAGPVVVPDGGGQGENALKDADQDAFWGLPAVPFEVELALVAVEDRLDGLPQRLEEPRPCALGFSRAGRAQQADPGAGQI